MGRSRVERLNDLDLFSRSIAVIRIGSLFRQGSSCTVDNKGPNVFNLKVDSVLQLLMEEPLQDDDAGPEGPASLIIRAEKLPVRSRRYFLLVRKDGLLIGQNCLLVGENFIQNGLIL
jgi:hypothetical protein